MLFVITMASDSNTVPIYITEKYNSLFYWKALKCGMSEEDRVLLWTHVREQWMLGK